MMAMASSSAWDVVAVVPVVWDVTAVVPLAASAFTSNGELVANPEYSTAAACAPREVLVTQFQVMEVLSLGPATLKAEAMLSPSEESPMKSWINVYPLGGVIAPESLSIETAV